MNKTRILTGLLVALCAAQLALAAAPPRELAEMRAQLAIEYMRYGNMRVALENADQAIAVDPTFQAGYLARALIYMQLRVDSEAEASFRKALSIQAGNPEVNNNYGLFLCNRRRFDEALARFDQALADPFFSAPHTALINKAVCLGQMNRNDEANQLLLEALRRAPNDASALRELTRLALQGGNAQLAQFYFERLGKDEKRFGPAELLLGVKLARLKKDAVTEQRLAGLLKSRHPDSLETQQLLSGT
ncbi:type IV pilus biogenesis/stability protein PilW [Vogesella sp. DC21W]|uniref:Type IV pilus biogenesis/stability protein PilW n=1 Tax=Vogesella aquatica TaxID=2984206 RepID=A0ABT5IVC1_9NEIS|nr:type IV pilus biogenesis/stability protein PilW [Vogesella aquatica]MDC7716516.1 type IV pilus biogenesis/stability protein PilW [Vogesella aquatica]